MSSSDRRKVVVTGIGPVTPIGTGRDAFWEGLTTGRNGIFPIDYLDTTDLPVTIAGRVQDFEPADYLGPKEIRRTDRFVQLGIAASQLAWKDAGEPDVNPERAGVVIGSGVGGITTILEQAEVLAEKGPRRVSPFTVPALMANAVAGHVAMQLGFMGPNLCTVSACASGAHAVGESYRLVRDGYVDVAVAGGAESGTLRLTISAFANMTALTKNSDVETASRPFDANRNGFVLSEGGVALILESEEHANARGAHIYAEIAGYGASADAYHITAPDPKGTGAALAIRWALEDAGEDPSAVDYVNAHGTSTQLNDAGETAAIKAALGEENAHRIAISSVKSMTGHLLGAAGAMEAAATALTLQNGIIPPTIHYETPDPECDLDYVPNEAREADVRFAISNSFGFGGQNAVIALRKVASET
ncbi:MAG: beta-ketoacyl-ACP synthase II [Actinomycetota bacterium]